MRWQCRCNPCAQPKRSAGPSLACLCSLPDLNYTRAQLCPKIRTKNLYIWAPWVRDVAGQMRSRSRTPGGDSNPQNAGEGSGGCCHRRDVHRCSKRWLECTRGVLGWEEKLTDARGAELWGAAQHPQPRAALWDVIKAQLRFGRWDIEIFFVQENGGTVWARSDRE